MEYNRPKINIFFGLLASVLHGSLMPIFGALMSKMLFVLMKKDDLNDVRNQANIWCGVMLLIACVSYVTGFSNKFSFGVIGENVTLKVRNTLYEKIIKKHMGWFDQRENAPGVLTSTLSSDA